MCRPHRRSGPLCRRVVLAGACVLSGAFRTVAAQVPSSPIYNPANGHGYQVIDVPNGLNWYDALAAAQIRVAGGYRGHLATITRPEESQFVVEKALGGGGCGCSRWLGGYQNRFAPDYREPGGGWRWVTGEPWGFSLWRDGAPNHEDDADVLVIDGNGTWGDQSALARASGYIVEYEPSHSAEAAVELFPPKVSGGARIVAQVTLPAPAGPGGARLGFHTSDPTAADVPNGEGIIVLPGATMATFPIQTHSSGAAPARVTLTVADIDAVGTAILEVLPQLPSASENLLVNGSFEEPLVPPGQAALTLRPGSTLPGWKITRGTIEVVPDRVWDGLPGAGHQSLDLAGESPGLIEQTLPTAPGQVYLLSGAIAHDPVHSDMQGGRADVFLNGEFFVQLVHREPAARRRAMAWWSFWYLFRATSPTTRLSIADVSSPWEYGGLVLDNLGVNRIDDWSVGWLPSRPDSLLVRALSSSEMELVWVGSHRDTTAFEIQRRTDAEGWSRVARVSATSASDGVHAHFIDYGIHPNTRYTYRVRAENALHVSPWCDEVSGAAIVGR